MEITGINPDWAVFVWFVDKHSSGLSLLTFITLVLIFGTAIAYICERKPAPKKARQVERHYKVRRGREDVADLGIDAYDFDILQEGERQAWINFLGPLDDDGNAPTVAAIAWDADYEITSVEAGAKA